MWGSVEVYDVVEIVIAGVEGIDVVHDFVEVHSKVSWGSAMKIPQHLEVGRLGVGKLAIDRHLDSVESHDIIGSHHIVEIVEPSMEIIDMIYEVVQVSGEESLGSTMEAPQEREVGRLAIGRHLS